MTSAVVDLGFGGTTSPTKNELIRFARLVLDNAGVSFSQNKIVRLVIKFRDRCPEGSGWMFFLLLTHEVGLTEKQKAAALRNPDIAHTLGHPDPTAITAIRNVMRERGH